MNVKGQIFASYVTAVVSLLTIFVTYPLYKWAGVAISLFGALMWVGIAKLFQWGGKQQNK